MRICDTHDQEAAMIRPITSKQNIELAKPIRRDNTFAEVLQKHLAIQIDKVETPEGAVLYDRETAGNFEKYIKALRERHGA